MHVKYNWFFYKVHLKFSHHTIWCQTNHANYVQDSPKYECFNYFVKGFVLIPGNSGSTYLIYLTPKLPKISKKVKAVLNFRPPLKNIFSYKGYIYIFNEIVI